MPRGTSRRTLAGVAPGVPSAPPTAPRPAHVLARGGGDPDRPEPAVVLEHLARVGLYEPGGGATPAWEAPPRQKSRGAVAILIATVLGWLVYTQRQAARASTMSQVESWASLLASAALLVRFGGHYRCADGADNEQHRDGAHDLLGPAAREVLPGDSEDRNQDGPDSRDPADDVERVQARGTLSLRFARARIRAGGCAGVA